MLGQLLDRLAIAADVAQLTGLALVAHHGHRQRPALTGLTDHVGGRHPGPVEHDLAELLGDAVDHLQRQLLDPWLIHRHDEGGDALVLRHLVVRASQGKAPVGVVGVARPDLVAVEHVLVAVAVGPRAQGGEVRSRIRLAEPLAPTFPAVHQPRQEPLLDLDASVPEDAEHEVAEPRSRRCSSGGQLLVEDDVVDTREALAADFLGPRQAEEAGAVQRLVPRSLARPVGVVGRRCRQVGVVVGHPRPQALTEGRLVGRVTEVHCGPRSRGARAPCPDWRRHRRGCRSRAGPDGGRRGPCTPRCCRCRRAPG